MKTFFVALVLLLSFEGCGYKPSAIYARSVLGSKVSVDVDVNSADPENSVIIKDAVLQALITRFKVITTSRKFSVTHLDVKLGSVGETAIEYDVDGYVIGKRITTNLSIIRHTKGVKKSYNVTGTFDFRVEPNAIVSATDRFKAIKAASLKAIDVLIVQLAVEGSM